MVARRAHNPKVEGSSPSPATRCGGVAQLARAFGSYPECHWFESSRRYQSQPPVRHASQGVLLVEKVRRRRALAAMENPAKRMALRGFMVRPVRFERMAFRVGV